MNKKIIFLIVMCLALFTLAACSSRLPQKPIIGVDQPIYDFGEAYSGDTIEHNFLITNKGGKDLVIERTKTSCGCTAVTLERTPITIKSNQSTGIKVSFNTQNRKDKQTKTVHVFSNDPDRPDLELTVKGNLKELVVMEPKRVTFEEMVEGKEKTETVILTNNSNQPLTLYNLSINSPNITAKLVMADNEIEEAVLQPSQSAQVKISGTLPEKKPNLMGLVKLSIKEKENIVIRIHIQGKSKNADAMKEGQIKLLKMQSINTEKGKPAASPKTGKKDSK